MGPPSYSANSFYSIHPSVRRAWRSLIYVWWGSSQMHNVTSQRSSAPAHCIIPLPWRQISIISGHNSPICPHRPARRRELNAVGELVSLTRRMQVRPRPPLTTSSSSSSIRPPRSLVHDVCTAVAIAFISPSEHPFWHSPERLAVATRSSADSNQFKQQPLLRRL